MLGKRCDVIELLARDAAARQLEALETLAEREGSQRLDLGWAKDAPHASGFAVLLSPSGYRYWHYDGQGNDNALTREEALALLTSRKERVVSEGDYLMDARFLVLAREIAAELYAEGQFGEQERPEAWLEETARELGKRFQGAFEDWIYDRDGVDE